MTFQVRLPWAIQTSAWYMSHVYPSWHTYYTACWVTEVHYHQQENNQPLCKIDF